MKIFTFNQLVRYTKWVLAITIPLCLVIAYGIYSYPQYQNQKLEKKAQLELEVHKIFQANDAKSEEISALKRLVVAQKEEIEKLKKQLHPSEDVVVGITPVEKEEIHASAPEIKCPKNATAKNGKCTCKKGFAWSLDKRYCVWIPENAHPVVSKTDVWLCDKGYVEIGNGCVAEEDVECPLNASIKNGKCECSIEYAMSYSGTECIWIPPHAHAKRTKYGVWECDQGYREIEETCVRVDFLR